MMLLCSHEGTPTKTPDFVEAEAWVGSEEDGERPEVETTESKLGKYSLKTPEK